MSDLSDIFDDAYWAYVERRKIEENRYTTITDYDWGFRNAVPSEGGSDTRQDG